MDKKKYNSSPMIKGKSGFEELPHTADWQLRVWAESLPMLFVESARGMNALMGIKRATGPSITRIYKAEAADPESLLVAFLSELIWGVEQENLVFEASKVAIKDSKIRVRMSGSHILSINKSIKAVTYHNLKIRQTGTGFQVEIVFDV